jgi:hypothetical protein
MGRILPVATRDEEPVPETDRQRWYKMIAFGVIPSPIKNTIRTTWF